MKFRELKQAIYEDFAEQWRKTGHTKAEPVSYFARLFSQEPGRVKKAIKQMLIEGILIVCEETPGDEPYYRLSPMTYMMTVAGLESMGEAPLPPDGESWIQAAGIFA